MTRYKHKGVISFGIGFERWSEAECLDYDSTWRYCDRLHVRIAFWCWTFHLHPRLSRWRTGHEQAELAAFAIEKYDKITKHKLL